MHTVPIFRTEKASPTEKPGKRRICLLFIGNMDSLSVCVQSALTERLGYSRVAMDGVGELLERGSELYCKRGLPDDLGGTRSKDMHAEYLTVFLTGKDLYHAVRVTGNEASSAAKFSVSGIDLPVFAMLYCKEKTVRR